MVNQRMNAPVSTGSAVDLSQFRYHTGARPTPLAEDEHCPPLFRDVGVEAMRSFMRGELSRLCGPMSPITYLRTADYQEPYIDYGMIGRIMLLSPQQIQPWKSGVESVFIGPRSTLVDPSTMVFVPAEIPLADASRRFFEVRTRTEFLEAYGADEYGVATEVTLTRLDHLRQTLEKTERMAGPLRRRFQSADQRQRDEAREWMQQLQLAESDLCTAWHHLPSERREFIAQALLELPESLLCPAN